ncbi:MAG: hypothetical protein H8E44_26255 [Planctomycetes bacterium]|nr:hypothetical protein [Planctomycetota bacterium]
MSKSLGDHSTQSHDSSRRSFLRQSAVVAGTAVGGAIASRACAEDATEERDSKSFAAGAAITNLTPDRELPHYYGKMMKPAKGDSDLLCHAVVFSDGRTQAAIVSCDATFVHRPLVLKIREEVQRQSGIPGPAVLIAATHTHASPATGPSFLAGALPDPEYLDFFTERVVRAVLEAKAALRPATLAAGKCPTPGFEFNRRFLRPDGTVTLAPGKGSKLEPAGPADTTMQYLAFEDRAGSPVAIVINYPCHNNCCGGYYHRDLGGRAGDALRRQLAGRFATPFLAAPCGDVVWLDFRSPPPTRGDELACQIGEGIARQIVSSLERSQRREDISLQVRTEVVEIPDRALTDSTFCHDLCRGESEAAIAFARRRYDPEREAIAAGGPTVCPVEFQVISFGSCAIVTNPAELFVEFGIEIKRRSPFDVTLVSELTNGYCGYVPTMAAFQQGGYETHRTVRTSRLVKDGGRRIVEKSLDLLSGIHRQEKESQDR